MFKRDKKLKNKIKLRIWSRTVKGKKTENEDDFYIDEENGIFIIADGMSGCEGKYASTSTTEYVGKSIRDLLFYPPPGVEGHKFLSFLKAIVERANERLLVYSKAALQGKRAGTTLDVVILKDEVFYYIHIGDSTIYALFEDREVEKLTKDQTSAQMKFFNEEFSAEQSKVMRDYSQLISFLGDENFRQENIITGSIIVPPLKLVLVTDGITDVVTKEEWELLIKNNCGEELLNQACQLHKEPGNICELYLRYNSKFVINLLEKQKDDRFSDLKRKISFLEDETHLFSFITSYFEEKKYLKKVFLEKIRYELSEQDNFSIIVLEIIYKCNLFRRIYERFRKVFRKSNNGTPA